MIYVHVPFCRSFCTYCDFYSEVAAKCRRDEDVFRQNALFGEFGHALASEALRRAEEITDDVNTLYIGGGTPSVLPLSVFEELLSALRSLGHGGPFTEFTVEVNPEDIVEKGEGYVEGLLRMGVNRISMGVQSFDDSILRFMNRRHSAAVARQAYGILENAGVSNISIDLIFGLPQLSSDLWSRTLEEALSISPRGDLPKHISSYQLSVEEGSALADLVAHGLWSEASEELCSEQYSMLCSALAAAGYNHYEISNFALPGFEAVHNSAYWNHVPYVGLGPGAHSFMERCRCRVDRIRDISEASDSIRLWNRPDLQAYLDDCESCVEYECLTPDQLTLERVMLGLRTAAGLPAPFLSAHCDPRVLSRALASGDLVPALPQPALPSANSSHFAPDARLRIPESRFFVSDSIIAELV